MCHSERSEESLSSYDSWIRFLLYPAALFVITSLVILAIVIPLSAPYRDMANLFLLEEKPVFSTDKVGGYTTAVRNNFESKLPQLGEQFATLYIDSCDIEVPVFYGDGPDELRRGVGLYAGAFLPSQNGTILGGAHNNTWFKTLKDAEAGDEILIATDYGDYYYSVTGSQIARFDDWDAFDLERSDENIILYTCHNSLPFGATPWRVFVYADFIPEKSGKQLK